MIDTIVVVVMFILPAIPQKEKPVKLNKEEMKEQLKAAFEEAGRKADEATRKERERLYNFMDMYPIIEELKKNSVKSK
ncbi:hypothetical protein [Bacteroides thetaiotaomicron]|uniref:hypothetical protein n=1 Tax=Bacteroides thetaiotaomicron TaxID=818 RepID=UPI003565FFC8